MTLQLEHTETPQLAAARQLLAVGISVIPVRADGSKAPAVGWKEYQVRRASPDELEGWYAPGSTLGVGVVTGDGSGKLEMAEVEGRATDRIPQIAQLAQETGHSELWDRLCKGWLEQSPSGGWHWLYKVDWPEGTKTPGNMKIAFAANGEVLAETRGEGGYCIVAPTNGTVHASGNPWTLVTGGPGTIPVITPDEREDFHALLATMQPETATVVFNQPHGTPIQQTGRLTPGDDYENRTDWADILTPHGWTLVTQHDKTRHWRRPGKNIGMSATTGHNEQRDRLFVFTTSTEFDQETPYTKFGAYALLNHGGNYKAAAAALRQQGYGDPPPPLHGPIAPAGLAVAGAPAAVLEPAAAAPEVHHAFVDGGSFIFDTPDITPAVWGEGSDVLWAEGEALMIVGPPGVGKTTLTGQLVRGLLGLSSSLLGHPIRPCRKVLYMAMDRPAQVARSLKRHIQPHERAAVAENLIIWKGPPPADMAKNPHILKDLCQEAGADAVVIDSLKDAAIGLSEDAVGAGYNSARQMALAVGIQVLELHHQTKRGTGGSDKPNTLADVYGSTWITSGAGSVILLWGAAGDMIVELRHLKQPAEPVGPFKIVHDHDTGLSSIWQTADALSLIGASRGRGITARDLAAALYETLTPTPNETEKARRKLNALERAGTIRAVPVPAINGGTGSKVFHLPEESAKTAETSSTAYPTQTLEGVDPTRTPRHPRGAPKTARTSSTVAPTAPTRLPAHDLLPPERGRSEGNAMQDYAEHPAPPAGQQDCPLHANHHAGCYTCDLIAAHNHKNPEGEPT